MNNTKKGFRKLENGGVIVLDVEFTKEQNAVVGKLAKMTIVIGVLIGSLLTYIIAI